MPCHIQRAVALGLLLAGGATLLAAPVPAPPDPRSPREIEAARADLQELKRQAVGGKTAPVELFRRWRDFRARHPGTPECREAAALLARAPSPLDKLDRATIPAEDRPDWLPREVVALLGQNRGRSWGRFGELALSADGKLIVANNIVFEADTLRERAVLPPVPYPACRARGLASAPKGRVLARAAGTGVELWDMSDLPPKRTAVLDGHKNPVRSLAFLDGGKALVSAELDEVIFWDLAGPAPRKRRTLKRQVLAQLKAAAISRDGRLDGVALNEIEHLLDTEEAISPDGRFLVMEGSGNHRPALWRLSEDAPRPVPLPEACPPFVFTPDGQKLITGVLRSSQLSVWDLTGPLRRAALVPSGGWGQRGVDVSPDGTPLATAGVFDELCLWPLNEAGRKRLKLAPRETHRSYRLPPQVSRVKFAPDGRTLVVGCGCLLRLWDVDRQEERLPPRGHRAPVMAVAFAPDGAGLATGSDDGTLRLWGLTGAAPAEGELFAAEKQPPAGEPNAVGPLAFSPDGRFLAATQAGDPFQEYVYFWDLAAPKPPKAARVHLGAWPTTAGGCLFAPDGKTLVTLGTDANGNKKEPTAEDYANGTVDPDQLPAVRLWNWAGGEMTQRQLIRPDHPLLRSGRGMGAGPGAFSPDGRQLAVVVWADVHVYREAGGAFQEWACIRQGSDTATGSRAVFSGDGRALIVATHHNSKGDKPGYLDLRFWDLSGKEPRARTICRDEQGVDPLDLVTSPDGRTVAVATREGWLSVWDMKTEKRVRAWKLPGEVWGLSFAPDSRHLATANANGTAYVFRLPRPDRQVEGK